MGNTTKVGDLLCHSYVLPVSVTVQSVASHGVTLTDTGADPSFVWQAEDLAPGSREHITITDIVSPGLTADTRFTNTATIDGAAIDLNAFDSKLPRRKRHVYWPKIPSVPPDGCDERESE